MKISALGFFVVLFSFNSFAEKNHEHEKPCKAIVEACKNAGFEKGKAKEGFGLWKDCVHPIMRGEPQKETATKKLPTVAADLISSCKEKAPHFGQGRGKGAKDKSDDSKMESK